MKTAEGKEHFALGLDLTNFRHDINVANQAFGTIGDTAEREGKRVDSAFDNLGRKVAGAFAVGSLVEFERKIISVRGEMESLQISFETLAGKQVGRQLYNDIKQFAVTTPMLMGDLSKGAQLLLGFGISAEKVMPILRQIGDISMGDAQRFQSLSLAFAQMSSTGKLMGQDLLQMINAGFNPLTIIAEKTGKSVADLKDEMSKGKITVEMVEDAFRSATAEGGKFNGMLEKQGKGVKGAIAQMEGAIENALNGFGEQQQGIVVDGIHLVTEAINHYEELGKVILTVAAAYGSWKGAQMLVVAYQNVIAKQTAAVEAQRVASLQAVADQYAVETSAENADTAAVNANTAAKTGNTTAIDAEIAAIGRALAAKLSEAEANLAVAQTEAQMAANRLAEAQRSLSYYEKQYEAVLKLGDGEKIEAAENALNTAASNENAAAKAAQAAQDNVATAAKAKEAAATRLSSFQTQVDTAQKQANAAATGIWAAVTRSATAAMQGLKAAMASNPFGLALVAVTSIIGLLSLFTDETEEATNALDRLRDTVMEDTSKLNTYRAVLDTVDKKSRQYNEAMNKYNSMASEYNTTLLTENDTLEEQKRKYEELTAAIKANAAQKLLAEAASKADQDSMKAEKDAMDSLVEAAKEATHTTIELTAIDAGDKVIQGYGAVEHASQNIRNITTATWNAISQEVMEHSRDFAAAADQGEEAYKKAIDNEVALIKKMLKELGVTDKEMEEFEGNLHDYVQASADGFQTAYRELGRSEAQLNGIANAAVSTKDITNDAIDQMNYEQLQDELKKVQKEIDEVNAKDIDVQVKDQRLKDLRDLLVQINNLIPKQLTEGSDAALEKRLKQLKDDRDKYVYGSTEWTAKNTEIGTLSKTLASHKRNYAENADKTDSSGQTAAHKRAEERKKQLEYLDLQKELADERKRREFDLWADTEQAAIEAMADGSEKTLRQIELDFAQRKEELRRQYEDMRREKFEEDKRLWEADPSHKNTPFAGNISDSRYDLTATETEQLQRKQQAMEQQHANMLRDHSRDQIQALYDYLKEYGNIEQKKYAIAKEYDEKIAKEQDANRRRSLEAEKRSQMAKMSAQHIAESIDWGQTFEGVGNVLKGVAQETLKKVDEYMKSDEFRKLNPTDKKAYTDLRQQLVSAGGIDSSNPFSGRVWKEIGDAAERYRASVRQLNEANEHAEDVRKRLTKAEEDAAKNPADLGMQQQVDKLKQTFEEANTAVGQAETDVAGAQQDLQTKTQAAAKGIQDFNTVLGQITSGSLSGFATAVGNLIKKIAGSNDEVAKDFGELFGEAGKQIGGIIGVILQLIDILGTEPAKFIDDLLTKIADVLEAVLSQLPEIIASAIKGVGGIIGGVFSGIGNLVAGLFGLGVDNSPYEEAVEKWGWLLDSWEDNLKYERELMEKAYGGDLLTLQKETIDGLKNAQKAAAEIYRGWAGSGAGLFSHSNGYNVNEDTDWWALRNGNPDIYSRMDENVANLFNLDWRELEKLKLSNTKFWQSLHGEAQKYLDQYIEAGKAMVEVQKETWQKLTTTTSDDVFDSFLNSLYDLADGSEDVFEDIAENWQKMVNRMVINNLVGKKFQDRLNSWYESLAKLNEDKTNGQLTDAEYRKRLESLRQQYDSYVESAKRDIETMRSEGIIAATGDSAEAADQSATKKGFATASQDSIDELNGRFAGLMMIAEQSRGMIETSAADIAIIREFHAQHISIAQEIRNLAVLMVSHLEDISKYTKHLVQMDENVQYIKDKIN